MLVGSQESGYVKGEIEFKWIFYAAVDEDYNPPKTGLLRVNNRFWLLTIAILAVLTGGLFLLIVLKQKKQKEQKKGEPS